MFNEQANKSIEALAIKKESLISPFAGKKLMIKTYSNRPNYEVLSVDGVDTIEFFPIEMEAKHSEGKTVIRFTQKYRFLVQ